MTFISSALLLLVSGLVVGLEGVEGRYASSPGYPTTPSYPVSSPGPPTPSCQSSSTVTVTVTASCTTSQQASPTPSPGGPCLSIQPTCELPGTQGATGFDINYYNNGFGLTGYSSREVTPKTPSSYYLTQGLSPLGTSQTTYTYYAQNNVPATTPIYPVGPPLSYFQGFTRDTNGGIIVDANNFTLVYSGLLRAPGTGWYQLCTIGDNESDLFFGNDNAFSCSTGEASASAIPLVQGFLDFFYNGPLVGTCATVNLVQDMYYPIRAVTGNYQGPSAFALSLIPPGEGVASASADFTGLAYPESCGIYTGSL